jgi:DNA-binding Lrp family transcriptional regulator
MRTKHRSSTVTAVDRVDEAIVELLSRDARMPFSEIARTIGRSTSLVKRRVDSMLESGVIPGFTIAHGDDSSFEGTEAVVEIFCRGNVSTTELRALLSGLDGVVTAVTVAGAADAVLILRAADNEALGEIVETLRSSSRIDRTRTSIVLDRLTASR